MAQYIPEPPKSHEQDKKGLKISFFGVLWLAVVYGGYYAVHKPLDWATIEGIKGGLARLGGLSRPPSYMGWVDVGMGMAAAAWIILMGLLIGLRILGRLEPFQPRSDGAPNDRRETGLSPLERVALGTPLGLGAISLAVFFLGLGGLLHRWLFFTFFVLGSLILLPQLKGLKGLVIRLPGPPGRVGPIEKALAGYVGLALFLSFLAALAPPTSWDSLVYHLAAPKVYIENHRIISGVDIPYFYFPQLMEMLFTAGILLGGDISARFLHLGFAFLGVLGVFSFCRRFLGGDTPWVASAILLSAPSLLSLSSQAYGEWGLILYSFLAFWAAIEGMAGRGFKWFVLSGVFGGLAVGVKYTGWVMVFALGALLLWNLWPKPQGLGGGHPSREGLLRSISLWAGAVLLTAAPWYIKNLIFTGNPVYPFLFGGWNWDPWRAEWFSRFGTGLASASGGPFRLLIAPWEMTVLGTEGTLFYDATIGPMFLALLPLVFAVKMGPVLGRAAFVALAGYAFWLYGVAQSSLLIQTRLLFPIFPFLAVLAAGAVDGLRDLGGLPARAFSLWRFILAALILALSLNLISQAGRLLADSPFPFLMGRESRAGYLARHMGGLYEAMEYINGDLEPQDKVLFLWEPRSYYCQVSCQPDPLLNNWRYALFRYGGADGILEAWKKEGYTHLLVSGRGLRYFSEPSHQEVEDTHLEALRDMERKHLKRLFGPGLDGGDEYTLYQISPFSP